MCVVDRVLAGPGFGLYPPWRGGNVTSLNGHLLCLRRLCPSRGLRSQQFDEDGLRTIDDRPDAAHDGLANRPVISHVVLNLDEQAPRIREGGGV